MNESETKRAIEARRAYHRVWREKHRDRVREYNQTYWLKRAERERLAAQTKNITEEKAT